MNEKLFFSPKYEILAVFGGMCVLGSPACVIVLMYGCGGLRRNSVDVWLWGFEKDGWKSLGWGLIFGEEALKRCKREKNVVAM